MQNEVSNALTHTVHVSTPTFDAVNPLVLNILLFPATVSYLVIFHIFLAMFIWAYWKAIWSRPASPSKAVSALLSNSQKRQGREDGGVISWTSFPLCCQFSLPRAEKELYEREERAEAQQEILKKVARNLPVYTRTAGGGKALDTVVFKFPSVALTQTTRENCQQNGKCTEVFIISQFIWSLVHDITKVLLQYIVSPRCEAPLCCVYGKACVRRIN